MNAKGRAVLLSIIGLLSIGGYCRALAAQQIDDTWYLPTEDHAARLFVEELGPANAEPVIVLHGGWGADHSYLLPVLRPLAGPSRRFVLYDQRGSLLSPAPVATLSVKEQVEDLDLLRRTLGVDKVTIMAHSMGTFLAMSYAKAHPEHVKKLILIGVIIAKTPIGGADAFWENSKAYADKLVSRPEVTAELAKIKAVAGASPKDDTHRWRIKFAAVNIYHIERWPQMLGGQVFYKQSAADAIAPTMGDSWDFESVLTSGMFPVILIDGDTDYVDPHLRYWRAFTAKNPEVHLIVLPQAEHCPWIDQPRMFATVLVRALYQK